MLKIKKGPKNLLGKYYLFYVTFHKLFLSQTVQKDHKPNVVSSIRYQWEFLSEVNVCEFSVAQHLAGTC